MSAAAAITVARPASGNAVGRRAHALFKPEKPATGWHPLRPRRNPQANTTTHPSSTRHRSKRPTRSASRSNAVDNTTAPPPR